MINTTLDSNATGLIVCFESRLDFLIQKEPLE